MQRARSSWPAHDNAEGWETLANLALQLESQQIDLDESLRWAATVKLLVERNLPYTEYTAARMAALTNRLRQRKLDQTNLRYKYGFKPRSERLVRKDIMIQYAISAAPDGAGELWITSWHRNAARAIIVS
ncbi:hypothetical protein E3O45_05940 [Cryobacterium sp. TMS1-20-1]|uniref:hypothetical protein n=1 Tax=Cryobacterium sp. TMS1-20-1 TaxID=1259223 RepID=UPI00106C9314|nr:hypothetical protein [Cryobacterium sp. TMS1-20-1]TFC78153.1 hypothetical protein E3O45_05940 [Cryobacterium sp. TMS1-20-1]